MSTLFRFRYEELGGHTHVRVFAGANKAALAKCGDLVFRNDEWSDLVGLIYHSELTPFGKIEIMKEDE